MLEFIGFAVAKKTITKQVEELYVLCKVEPPTPRLGNDRALMNPLGETKLLGKYNQITNEIEWEKSPEKIDVTRIQEF